MDPQNSQELDFSGRFLPRLREIPSGVKWVTLARTIRWFGWGAEVLLPVFILTFSASLTEAGLINASYDVVFLFSLPIVGFVADAVSSKLLLIIGLLIYPFIGLSFYLAGATGLVFFLILARALNGASYCLDSVGMDTYLRRTTRREVIASAFGYIGSWANFGWLFGGLLCVWLVQFVPLYVLFFMITPLSLMSLIPLLRAPRDTPLPASHFNIKTLASPLAAFLKEVAAMRKGLKSVVLLMFVFDIASVAAMFFIPIDAYRNGASLSAVAFLVVITGLPSLSEFWLAEFIDGSKTKRRWALFLSLAALPLLFVVASLSSAFSVRIIIALGIEIAAVFGSLALQSYATMLSRRSRYGQISSMLEGSTTAGDLVGPIAIGLITDALGFPLMFASCACIFFAIAWYFFHYPIER